MGYGKGGLDEIGILRERILGKQDFGKVGFCEAGFWDI